MKSICLIVLDRYFRQVRALSVVATTRQKDYNFFNEGRAKDASWS